MTRTYSTLMQVAAVRPISFLMSFTSRLAALCIARRSGLVYQGAFVMGEFNGYCGERMESQGHVNAAGESEFVLERHLSAGLYHYYFLIDGRKRIDKTKPTTTLNGQKRNIVTVCNPSILGGQGGPYNDGRMASKNFDAVLGAGGDVSTIVANSTVDMEGKISRGNSRAGGSRGGGSRMNGSRPGTNNSRAIVSRPSSTEGQHRLNAIMTPSNEGMSPTFLQTRRLRHPYRVRPVQRRLR